MSLTKLFLEEWNRTEQAQKLGIDFGDIKGETIPERLVRDIGYFSHPLESTKIYFSRFSNN